MPSSTRHLTNLHIEGLQDQQRWLRNLRTLDATLVDAYYTVRVGFYNYTTGTFAANVAVARASLASGVTSAVWWNLARPELWRSGRAEVELIYTTSVVGADINLKLRANGIALGESVGPATSDVEATEGFDCSTLFLASKSFDATLEVDSSHKLLTFSVERDAGDVANAGEFRLREVLVHYYPNEGVF